MNPYAIRQRLVGTASVGKAAHHSIPSDIGDVDRNPIYWEHRRRFLLIDERNITLPPLFPDNTSTLLGALEYRLLFPTKVIQDPVYDLAAHIRPFHLDRRGCPNHSVPRPTCRRIIAERTYGCPAVRMDRRKATAAWFLCTGASVLPTPRSPAQLLSPNIASHRLSKGAGRKAFKISRTRLCRAHVRHIMFCHPPQRIPKSSSRGMPDAADI